MDARLLGIAPLVPVRDLAASTAFPRVTLGFRVVIDAPASNYATVARDAARIGPQGRSDEGALAATRTNIAACVLLNDLDAVWRELAPRCADLPPGRVRPPFRQDYGVRELYLKDPDGFPMLFGEAADEEEEA